MKAAVSGMEMIGVENGFVTFGLPERVASNRILSVTFI